MEKVTRTRAGWKWCLNRAWSLVIGPVMFVAFGALHEAGLHHRHRHDQGDPVFQKGFPCAPDGMPLLAPRFQ